MATASSTTVSTSLVLQTGAAGLSSSSSAVNGASLAVPLRVAPVSRALGVSCRAKVEAEAAAVPSVSRRLALALVAGFAAAGTRIAPANAAYGEAANVFGTPKQQSGFTPYSGEGFSLEIPSKWNPSKEIEFPGQVLRYEDNFDQVCNLSVSVTPSSKGSIKDYGPPEKFLDSISYVLGKQSYSGKTTSEGGFDPNAVATAAVLESTATEVNGKPYYKLTVLTRTADGDEGGRHQLIVATISNGNLYLMKAQAGDKRWFKGLKKFVEGAANSFSVA